MLVHKKDGACVYTLDALTYVLLCSPFKNITVAYRFPDRTTQVGGLINEYLQSSVQTDDRAIHLLFSANRWEAAPNLVDTLAKGTNIVCDRYAYSGVAFTSAKAVEDRSSMSGGELTLDWCMSPDVG